MTQRFSLLLLTSIDTTSLFEMIFLASNQVWQYFCHQPTHWIFLFRVHPSYLEKAFLAVFEICCYWTLLSLFPPTPYRATFFSKNCSWQYLHALSICLSYCLLILKNAIFLIAYCYDFHSGEGWKSPVTQPHSYHKSSEGVLAET